MSEALNVVQPQLEERVFRGVRVVRTYSAPMDAVVASLRARVGRMSFSTVIELSRKAVSIEDFEFSTRNLIPESGFVIFDEIDHGAWLQRFGLGLKSLRWIFGNPIIAQTMIRHDATAGLFVPVELLFTELPDSKGCAIAYVVPSSLMMIDDNPPLAAAASRLDRKLEALFASMSV